MFPNLGKEGHSLLLILIIIFHWFAEKRSEVAFLPPIQKLWLQTNSLTPQKP